MVYQTILLKGDGVQNFLPVVKMGYEIFSYSVKLSSTLAPRIKNDRSLMEEIDGKSSWHISTEKIK